MRDMIEPCRHAVERTMRFEMIELHSLGIEKPLERSNLVDDAIGQLVTAHLHLAAAEALQIRQRGVRADLDAMFLGTAYRLAHVIVVGSMKAAGDVRDRDIGHEAFVVAQSVKAETLAHVTIDLHRHRILLSALTKASPNP